MKHSRLVFLAVLFGIVGALTFSTTIARAAGAAVHEATAEQKATARDAFIEARAAFDDKRFADALKGFRKSYHVVASPNTHLMMANALRELGRYAASYSELQKVIEEADTAALTNAKYANAAAIAREQLQSLREKLGFLTVDVVDAEDDATLTIGDREIPKAMWGKAFPVDPGKTVLVLHSKSGEQTRKLELEAGIDRSITMNATAESGASPDEPVAGADESLDDSVGDGDFQRIMAYASGGAGGVAFLMSGIFGGLAASKHSDLESSCRVPPCPALQDDIDSGRTFQTVSNVMIVLGVVGVGTGAALYFTAPASDDASSKASRSPRGVRAVFVGLDGVGLRGSF